jgi:hypothetical protein
VEVHREAVQQAELASTYIDHWEEGIKTDAAAGRKWIQPMTRDSAGPRVQSPALHVQQQRKALASSPITHTQQIMLPPEPGTPKKGVNHSPEKWGKRVQPKHSQGFCRNMNADTTWWSSPALEVSGGSAVRDSKHAGAHLAGGHTVIRRTSTRNNIRPVSAHYELRPQLQQVFKTRLQQRDRGAVFTSRVAKRNKGHRHYTDKHMWSQVQNSKLPMIG